MSCEPSDDTRGPGWYCCRENTWNPEDAPTCRVCGAQRHRAEATLDFETKD